MPKTQNALTANTMKTKMLFTTFLFLACAVSISAQQREFSKWDATAFCSYTTYHPYHYIRADNNWEIMQALRTPHTRQYLDSLGIKKTSSQMMLLHIGGLINKAGNGNWLSTMPILDSLQTLEARNFSSLIAKDLYREIKNDCISLVDFLKQQNLHDNAYSILFSYVLDGRIWKSFHDYSSLKSSATWDGECWALYSPRKFKSGTNTYFDEFAVCWTANQPEFVWQELDSETFIKPFLEEYNNQGKITTPELLAKSLALGLINKDGLLRIPVIDSKNSNSQLNILSNRIIEPIVHHFTHSDVIPTFQEKFGIHAKQKKLACTMLYHEVMWDLIDLLIKDEVMKNPILWEDLKMSSTHSVVFIQK